MTCHRYDPPLMYMLPSPVVEWTADLDPISDVFSQPRAIHCGPPAPYPRVPTPYEILRGAGLGHPGIPDVEVTGDGSGRAGGSP